MIVKMNVVQMKDRHENIGFGEIGFDALQLYRASSADLKHIPKILETPFVGADPKKRHAPYKIEIEMFRSKSVYIQKKLMHLTS